MKFVNGLALDGLEVGCVGNVPLGFDGDLNVTFSRLCSV
jgi:hypothetical protein